MNFKKIIKSIALFTTLAYSVKAETACEEIENYLNSQDLEYYVRECEMNKAGDVTSLLIFKGCLSNENINHILDFAPNIRSLTFIPNLRHNWGDCDEYQPLTSQFKQLSQLDELSLEGIIDIKANDIAKLPRTITKLTIGVTVVDQSIVNELGKLSNLEELSFYHSEFKNGLIYLPFNKLKNLIYLSLPNQDYHFDLDLDHPIVIPKNFFKYFKNLEKLDIDNCVVSKDNLNEIQKLTNLKEININDCEFGDGANIDSINNLKNLKSLDLNAKPNTYHTLKTISTALYQLPNLTRLSLENNQIYYFPQTETLSFANLKNLKKLFLENNNGVIDLEPICTLEKLERLNLWNNRVLGIYNYEKINTFKKNKACREYIEGLNRTDEEEEVPTGEVFDENQ